VREGCARHGRWNSVVVGSLKKFKGLYKIKSLLKITLSLQHHRFPSLEPEEWPSEPTFASEGYPPLPDFLMLHGETDPELQHDALFPQCSLAQSPTSLLALSEGANLASHYLGTPNFFSETTPGSSSKSLENMDVDQYIDPQLSALIHSAAGPYQSSIHVPFEHECSMERLFYENNCHDADPVNVTDGFDIDPNIFNSSNFPYFSVPSPDVALN
jgi:hypothetical protein